jgi:Spy/CpxP family protein refolding chaperone
MKTRSPVKKLAAVVLAASALVGCSVSAPSAAKNPVVAPPAVELSAPSYQVLVEEASEHSKKMSEFLAQLALTDAQKTELKGVFKNALERAKPMHEALKPLVTGESVDTTTLQAAMATALKEDAANDAKTMEELRQVLTPEQRTLIANKLMEMSQQSVDDDPHSKLFTKLMDKASSQLTMSETQKAAFNQMKSDLLAFWAANRAAYYTAMAKHMQDGKEHDLHHEFERLIAGWNTNSAVSFIASLDQSQRQAMVAWKEGLMEKIASKLQ